MATPRKKAAANKTSTPANKPAAKKTAPAQKAAQNQGVDEKSSKTNAKAAQAGANGGERDEGGVSEEQLKALASRRKSPTPATKNAPKRAAPVVFTLEDVREVLKNRREEQEEERKEAARQAAAVKRTEVKVDEPVQQRVLGAATLADILGFNPQQPKKPAPISDDREVPEKFRKYYNLLMELREHVLNDLDEHSKETLKRSPREDSGDVANFSSHMADNGTDAFDRDFALSLLANEKEALHEIDAAIKRIHDGSYGVCEITGKPIAQERLQAVPFTRYSLEGQAEYEKNTRKRMQRSNAFLDLSEDSSALSMDDGDE